MTTPDPFLQMPGDDARPASAQPAPQPVAPGYAAPPAGMYPPAGYTAPAAPYETAAPAPYEPGPGYSSAPGYGYTPPARPGTDGVSIAALVTGLLGMGPIAVVLGALGLRRTAEGRRGGTVMAWFGVALGILATITWTATVTAAVVASAEISEAVQEGIEGSAATYGDDPALDALWDACEAGDNGACDDLYNDSPFGSAYEEFGSTCGGRGLPLDQVWCEP